MLIMDIYIYKIIKYKTSIIIILCSSILSTNTKLFLIIFKIIIIKFNKFIKWYVIRWEYKLILYYRCITKFSKGCPGHFFFSKNILYTNTRCTQPFQQARNHDPPDYLACCIRTFNCSCVINIIFHLHGSYENKLTIVLQK